MAHQKNILLIEDDTVLRENTAELLDLAGYQVSMAANGRAGLQMALEETPHLILCDIMMPEMDGYTVLKHLRDHDPTKTTPFIFLSAKTEHKDVRLGMNMGADDYVTKPFTEEELLGAVASRLAKMAILGEFKAEGQEPHKATMGSLHELKNHIDDHGTELSLATGAQLYAERASPNAIYLITKGSIKLHILEESGKELITAILQPDDIFGFASFSNSYATKESATALENSVLHSISLQELKDLMAHNPTLALEVVALLTENLSMAKGQLLEMAYGSVRKRTAHTLLKFSEKLQKDKHGQMHILRSDLANVAGVATETLIRTLSCFKKEGLIDIEERNIKILDRQGLEDA